jgi:4-hydroxy-tetrahydrodipicolinate synthase
MDGMNSIESSRFNGRVRGGREWKGVVAAALTPLRDDLGVDGETFSGHIRWLLGHGCDGVVVLGTTGEAVSFSVAERMSALEAVVSSGVPADRLIVGTGCCAVPDTVWLTNHASSLGVARALVMPPFCFKNVPEDGIFDYYRRVMDATEPSGTGIYLYHFPQLTGVPIGEGLVAKLLDAYPERISGVKDSGGDPEYTRNLCARFPGLGVFAGSDALLLEGLRCGAVGCISATANVTAALAAEVFARRSEPGVDAAQERVSRVRGVFERYPLIPALKYVMRCRTGRPAWLKTRPPVCPLSPADGKELLRLLEMEGFSVA